MLLATKPQDALGLLTFLQDAVPSHKLSNSQAALAALDQPHLDWGVLDATFDLLRSKPFSAVAEQIVAQLQQLVQEAGLPSLATGLFAYAGHLLLRLSGKGDKGRVRCMEAVLELVGKVATLHNVPLPSPAVAEVSVAAVNLGTALARDTDLHHADTVPAVTVKAFLTQLTHAASKVGNDLREGKEVPDSMVPWAAAAMSCSYLLALQFGDNPCPKTRAAVWKELVPAAFLLMQFCNHCSTLPSRAEWQSLVRPALLLACAPRLLLGQVGVGQEEFQALRPLDQLEVMQGLVPLLKLISRWYHPHEDKEEEEGSGGSNSSCCSSDEPGGSSEGSAGSKAAVDVAGSSGSNSAGGVASTSAAAEGGGNGNSSGESKSSGATMAGASSSASCSSCVSRGGSEVGTGEAGGCSGACSDSKSGTEGDWKDKGAASKEDGSAAAEPQTAQLAIAEQVPKQQVGRALSDTLISLRLLLRNLMQWELFVQAGGVEMGLDHISVYTQYLREWKQRQQEGQQAQQQGAQQHGAAEAPAEAVSTRGLGGAGQGPPGDDSAHQILVALIDCMCMAMANATNARGFAKEAQTSFISRQGFRRALDCLDETPPMAELVKQAEEGRLHAWEAKRAVLHLIEAVMTGRDFCKAAFAASDAFRSIWRCISPLGLSQEEEARMASSNSGLVRGVLGNAMSVLACHGVENFPDEKKEAEERCKQLAGWLEGVTTLPELLALLKWQPRGYDSVQAALEGKGSSVLHLHAALLCVAWHWVAARPSQLELLASDPSLRAPFLEALRLPEEHRMKNNSPIPLEALTLLVKAHPSCVPELLEEGLMQDLLQQLLYWFRDATQEEAGRGHVCVISGVTNLLEAMEGGCHKVTMLQSLAKQQQLQEQLTRLLRKTNKFTDASLQKGARYVMHLLRLAGQAKAATVNATGALVEGKQDEGTASKVAAEVLRAEGKPKQKGPAQLGRRRRQKGKQKEREEREQQEREERERAERGRQAREEEEEQLHQQEHQAAGVSGQQSRAAKKKKKAKGAPAVLSQQPVASSSSLQGEPTMPAAPDTPTALPGKPTLVAAKEDAEGRVRRR